LPGPQTHLAQDDFIPRRGLRGGHVQTLASFFISRHFALPPPDSRMVEVAPGIRVLCHCHWQADRRNALTLILVHGFEGSSESLYMTGITEKGLAAGMNVVRMNQRNCGGTEHVAPVLYHSGLSQDVAAVARHLLEHDHIQRLALAGYSMGGNLMLKLAGEWGANGPEAFRAVVVVCPALDLQASSDALHLPANRLYEQYFLWRVGRSMKAKDRHFPGVFDLSRMKGIRSLGDFDDRITAFYCGFQSGRDYYARAAASSVVDRIAVPTLILHAANDPFIRIVASTRQKIVKNPHITFLETTDGGHCSFIAAPNGYDGFWAEKKIVEFLREF